MALKTILTAPDPRLKKKSKPVASVDAEVRQLMDDMLETMYAAPGAGLAANQIGVPLRVCVVKGEENQHWGLVNPVLVKGEGSQIGYEGCLSFPGWVGEVERYETVVVKGLNRKGKEIRVKSSGFTARAFQHELDHLDGILFTDRLTDLGTLRRAEELEADSEAEPEAIQATEWIHDLIYKYKAHPAPDQIQNGSDTNMFAGGKVAD